MRVRNGARTRCRCRLGMMRGELRFFRLRRAPTASFKLSPPDVSVAGLLMDSAGAAAVPSQSATGADRVSRDAKLQ
jgi:hypothetical protein